MPQIQFDTDDDVHKELKIIKIQNDFITLAETVNHVLRKTLIVEPEPEPEPAIVEPIKQKEDEDGRTTNNEEGFSGNSQEA